MKIFNKLLKNKKVLFLIGIALAMLAAVLYLQSVNRDKIILSIESQQNTDAFPEAEEDTWVTVNRDDVDDVVIPIPSSITKTLISKNGSYSITQNNQERKGKLPEDMMKELTTLIDQTDFNAIKTTEFGRWSCNFEVIATFYPTKKVISDCVYDTKDSPLFSLIESIRLYIALDGNPYK